MFSKRLGDGYQISGNFVGEPKRKRKTCERTIGRRWKKIGSCPIFYAKMVEGGRRGGFLVKFNSFSFRSSTFKVLAVDILNHFIVSLRDNAWAWRKATQENWRILLFFISFKKLLVKRLMKLVLIVVLNMRVEQLFQLGILGTQQPFGISTVLLCGWQTVRRVF